MADLERPPPAPGPPAIPGGATIGMEVSLPRAAYVDPAHHDREREAIFWAEWVCAARAEQLPRPGDYLTVDVAGESVVVVRDRDGTLRAHYNLCRHRGSRLLPDDRPAAGHSGAPPPGGHLKGGFRCPYHSWTYALDGRLRAAPFLPELAAHRDALSLHPVGVAVWEGWILLNLSPWSDPAGAPPLAPAFAAAALRLRGYGLDALRTAHRVVYPVAADWKVVVENYNECYHCGPVHPELCRIVPAFKAGGGAGLDWDRGVRQRPGTTTFTRSGTSSRRPLPGIGPDERDRHRGELLLPNLMVSCSSDHVAAFILFPESAGRTRIVCDLLFHPDEIARPGFDPADAVEFWDLVNRQDWAVCESVQRGMGSRAFRHGFMAPMEDLSADVRRYLAARMGEMAAATPLPSPAPTAGPAAIPAASGAATAPRRPR
ncbi:MAG TPA: aromatic ring-hydroxylating dioxygenase subunit alpha [Candidatus Micrarchaeia archaeon]|nr:aromatic ring-hydroxylating dioxygenase subunit alpha [Candidatus Micrarchaeia archaeon]